ncbi:MAG: prepilin peptidase [Deltaproteobacteria bacterium]|nr:prepilin peptidase [Deltaproteobacteria bacterium]
MITLPTSWGVTFFSLLGLLIGSFLNVVIHRLPLGESVVKPRSHCPHCKHKIAFYDNIPLLSYLWLFGKCRHCKTPISFRYFFVELLTASLSVLFYLYTMRGWHDYFFFFCFLIAPLIAIFFIDLKHLIIPNVLTLPGILVGIAAHYSVFSPFDGKTGALLDSLFGIIVGGGLLFLIAALYKKLRKEEGLGAGDIKLAAMLGAFFGWQEVLMILLIASVVGSLIGLGVVAVRKDWNAQIPFGSFLSIAGIFQLFCGRQVLIWYMQFFN